MEFVVAFAATRPAGSARETSSGKDRMFLVLKDNGASALAYAKRFENVALYQANGIGRLKSLRLANPGEGEGLEKLSDFDAKFPNKSA